MIDAIEDRRPLNRLPLVMAACAMLAAPILLAQADSAAKPASPPSEVSPDIPKYEVATIKPSPAATEGRIGLMFTPDGTQISGVPLQMIVRNAFRVEEDRILGLPGWAKTNRYDIQAKVAPEDAPKLEKLKIDQRASMLLPVLEERFNLKYHHETRELPTYSLVIAKGGPKLKASTVPDLPPGAKPPVPGDGSQKLPPGDGPKTAGPGPNPGRGRMMRMMGPGHVEANGADLQALAHILSQQLGRSVVDKTGLTGNYDYTLNWTPDNATPPMPGGAEGGPPPGDIGSVPVGPSLITALQEQLGLKLESEKEKVDVIVIDHIDLPSEN